ncbi:condensation domain-containing protein [Streptomyces milbemycinicus]|uniref:Condensation domain-containing protein n=1 Tax=Streptomyces milbemycinicus TaxID=476552 RepID=A0ABW8M4X8_9ACTN
MSASFPLSAAQRAVWARHTRDPSGHRQSTLRTFAVTGTLDVAALRTAVEALVRRHEPLRTVYLDGPVQQIRPDAPVAVRIVSEPPLPRAFDLARGPLLRVDVRPTGPNRHEVTFSSHLLAADGWSLGVFFTELAACYRAALRGESAALPELPVQYVDWAAWQAERLTPERTGELVRWWRGALERYPRPLDANAGPTGEPGRGRRRAVALNTALVSAIRDLGAAHGHTAFTVLAAACAIALTRRTGHDRVLLGLAVAGRDRPEVASVLGFFATLSVLPVDLTQDPPFGVLLGRVAEATAATYQNRDLPLDEMVAALGGPDDPDRTPWVQAIFAYHPPGSLGELRLDGCETAELPVLDTAKFELTVRVEDTPDGAGTVWAEYDTARYHDPEIDALLKAYQAVLHAVVARPKTPVSALRALVPPPGGHIRG